MGFLKRLFGNSSEYQELNAKIALLRQEVEGLSALVDRFISETKTLRRKVLRANDTPEEEAISEAISMEEMATRQRRLMGFE